MWHEAHVEHYNVWAHKHTSTELDMQPQTNDSRTLAMRVACAGLTGASFALSLAPHPALAIGVDDIVEDVFASSWACFGVGLATGCLVTGIWTHIFHKRALARLEQRIEDLEDAAAGDEDLSDLTRPASPIDLGILLEEEARVDGTGAKESVESTGRHFRVPPASKEPGSSQRWRRTSSGQPVDSTIGDIFKVADDNDIPHIERGESSLELVHARNDLDKSHAMQVMRSLDPSTRSNMIKKRIPSLGALNEIPEVDGASMYPARPSQRPSDPVSRVQQILDEEMELSQKAAAREYSRSRLTVIEGLGESGTPHRANGMRQADRPRGKHFAPVSREA